MPRRNRRDVYEPLDLTPADLPAPLRCRPHEIDQGRLWREREHREQDARERQERARVNRGIDWSVCLVPGCGRSGTISASSDRDHTTSLPLCVQHLAVASQQASWRSNDPLIVAASALVFERKEARRQQQQTDDRQAWLARTEGSIYFVRLNGLVKVGWSRDVRRRLRAYGPNVEVLCIYPATRDDETNLHRQLRPVLARGREWYDDCKIVEDFVAAAIEKYGTPTVHDDHWTRPKAVIKPHRAAR